MRFWVRSKSHSFLKITRAKPELFNRNTYFCCMEDWQLDFEWLRVRHFVKDTLKLKDLPDFKEVMLLIGIQELGHLKEGFSKEEKEDLIHIATCHLLTSDGYFAFDKHDEDGWPHWKTIKPLKGTDDEKEKLLMVAAIDYFDKIIDSIQTNGQNN